MKIDNLLSAKTALLTVLLLLGIGCPRAFASNTATFNGSWSNLSTWGGNDPGFNIASTNDVIIPAGVTVVLDSDLTINGTLSLSGGILDLNGRNLNINGGIFTTGAGGVIGNNHSNVAFNGFGGAGNLVFISGNQVINDLTINIGSNSGMFLGSGLTINGLLSLQNGSLGLGDNNLVVAGKGIIQGGSVSSYVMTAGKGGLVMLVPNTGLAHIFPVGTQNNYAPVAVKNNSDQTGLFTVSAYEGVFSDGNTGSNISLDQSMVNTSWNITSSTAANTNVDLEMFWNTDMQLNSFNNTQAFISQYTTNGWDTQNFATATVNNNGSFSLKLAGVTSLSQYAVFGKNSATGIKNAAADTDMSLYPNPANGSINIALSQTTGYPLLKVFDAEGKEVITQQITSNLTTVNLTGLARGTYFASMNGETAQKFVKQ